MLCKSVKYNIFLILMHFTSHFKFVTKLNNEINFLINETGSYNKLIVSYF